MRTESETHFEKLCSEKGIPFERIQETDAKTADYKVKIGERDFYIEVKQIEADLGGTFRVPGKHVRAKIIDSKKQLKGYAQTGSPTILLIYNCGLFGTDPLDFKTGMYGELTIYIEPESKTITKEIFGKRKSFNENHNTSISAVGIFYEKSDGYEICLYENIYARNKISKQELPVFIKYVDEFKVR